MTLPAANRAPLAISTQVRDAIRTHAASSYPFECCGALLGSEGEGIEEALPFENAVPRAVLEDKVARFAAAAEALAADGRGLKATDERICFAAPDCGINLPNTVSLMIR